MFLALDGIEFGPTIDAVVRTGIAKVRTENYLAPALKQAWGDKLDFYSVPWGGSLRDDGQLANYLSLSRAQLCRIVQDAAGRPVVVIGHSWGSVVGYQAIRALETQPCPGGVPLPSGAVDLFVSMGSPLGSDLIEQTVKAIPGKVPGQELLGKPIAKPSTVTRWVNIAVKNDLIAAEIAVADANQRWDAGPNAVLRPAPLAYTYAHSAYYEKQDLVDLLAETIKSSLPPSQPEQQLAVPAGPQSPAPPVAAATPPETGEDPPTMRVELTDGNVLIGRIEAGKVPFASAFGAVEVDLGEIQDFADEALRLDDGSVLKGRFGEGMAEIATNRGNLKIPAQDIVEIAHASGNAGAPATAARVQPQAGQGVLAGRVIDNFGQPVPGATVRISDTTLSTETDSGGKYEVPYVPGQFALLIERSGYDDEAIPLQIAQPSTYPLADQTLVKVPPGNEVYFWGEKDWVPLGRCTVDQTQKDARDFGAGGVSSYAARGKPAAIVAAGPAAFLDATGRGSGLLLYRVDDDGTIIRIERKGGFGGVLGELQNDGPAAGAIAMDPLVLGDARIAYQGALGPGVYAFVQNPGGVANLVYPADVCFKFALKTAGQMLREQAEQKAAKPQTGDGIAALPAGVALAPGDEQTEAALNLDRAERRQVQGWLNALGFPAGTPDGLFGSGTRGAISAFQRSAAVADSGYLSDSQYQHLRTQGGRALAAQTVHATEASLAPIPGGCFQMGSPASEAGREPDEGPQHRVCVKPFKLSRFEVTVRDFRAFVAATGYRTDAERNAGGKIGCWAFDVDKKPHQEYRPWASWQRPSKYQGNRDDHPVTCVSWNDARAYIAWLSEVAGGGYRLPSEAEWEYAARAGTATARFWGNSPEQACRYANVADQTKFDRGRYIRSWPAEHACSDGQFWVAPVGSYRENPWGLYDVLGNAHEWTEGCWNESYKGAPEDGSAWTNGDCGKRVTRGGSWAESPRFVRSADRFREDSDNRLATSGFRVAKSYSVDGDGGAENTAYLPGNTPTADATEDSRPSGAVPSVADQPDVQVANEQDDNAYGSMVGAADASTEQALNLSRARRRQAQAWLGALGYKPGPADGVYGTETRQSIEAWQAVAGFPRSGFLNEVQIERLREEGESPEAQKIYWEAIRQTESGAVLKEYVSLYPDGAYSALARDRIQALRQAANKSPRSAKQGRKPSQRRGSASGTKRYSPKEQRAIDGFNNL